MVEVLCSQRSQLSAVCICITEIENEEPTGEIHSLKQEQELDLRPQIGSPDWSLQ